MRYLLVYFRFVPILLVLLVFPSTCPALYQENGDSCGLQVNGLFAAGIGAAAYPGDTFLYRTEREFLWNGDLRLVAEGFAGDNLRGKINILQNYRSVPAVVSLSPDTTVPLDVERSGLFYQQQHDGSSTRAHLVVDSGRISYGGSSQELVLGRQPVSLSVTFYFTPNDFFAPFNAQDFYRVYKPGVDAIRYERRLADLSQLSFIGVLGYAEDPESDSGWSAAPDWQRTSLVGRWIRSVNESELGLVGGIVREAAVVGVSYQGELFQWLGIRAEGHYLDERQGDMENGIMLSAGFEHRFAGSLSLRLEQMYNGSGYNSIDEAGAALEAGRRPSPYLGKHYIAFDLGYEFTPLLTGEFLYLRNWTDQSQVFSIYAVLSLSDESELAFTLALPTGSEPDAAGIHSELGLQPARCTLEYRLYF